MVPPLILNPQKDDKILDICAAPGSKTTQIAALMGNSGVIIANDTSLIRLYKLRANLKIQGVINTQTARIPGQTIWQKYPEYFDRVLADVPCSMEGRFYTSDKKTFQDWSKAKIKKLSEIQKWILRSAVSATKPGGTIVYSTCTLAPEENEGVIDWIIKKEKGNIIIEEIDINGLTFNPPLNKWGEKIYDPQIKLTKRILPGQEMEGFFIAKIRKLSSNIK
jgi:NOL1/NOP2/sun family putative RNA methylase